MRTASPTDLLAAGVALLAVWATAALAAPGVIVAPVTRLSFPVTVEALGTARANEAVEIRSQITETVTAIHFREGQSVRAGQLLVQLRDAPCRRFTSFMKPSVVWRSASEKGSAFP